MPVHGSPLPRHASVWSCPAGFPLLELGQIPAMSRERFSCAWFRTRWYNEVLKGNRLIPPFKQHLDLASLPNVVKKVKEADVKRLRIRYSVRTRECAGRGQREANLCDMLKASKTFFSDTCLSSDISDGCGSYGWHSMNAGVSRFSGLGFVGVNRARGREHMLVGLKGYRTWISEGRWTISTRMYWDK